MIEMYRVKGKQGFHHPLHLSIKGYHISNRTANSLDIAKSEGEIDRCFVHDFVALYMDGCRGSSYNGI